MTVLEISLRHATSIVRPILVSNSECRCKKCWTQESPIGREGGDGLRGSQVRVTREVWISWATSRINGCRRGCPQAVRRVIHSTSAFSSATARFCRPSRDSAVDWPPSNLRRRVEWLTLCSLATWRIGLDLLFDCSSRVFQSFCRFQLFFGFYGRASLCVEALK